LGGAQRRAEGPPKRLTLNVGGAFPPTHPTTRLCLELLREVLTGGPVCRLLDLGCGAGVLGLAAAALGVPLVVAVDIAEQAVRATLMNARRNGLTDSLLIAQGSTECLKTCFDLIAANLPLDLQMDKTKELDRLAAPSGSLILSGFRDNRENLLMEVYEKLGWHRARRLAKDFRHPELPADLSFTWVAWLLKRKPSL